MLFDDRPFGEGLKFEKWTDRLIYYDGRFDADFAFPFVAPNTAYRRRSSEQSSWFLKSHVEGPPMNAAETQDKLRAGDHSFLDRLMHFGGGVPRWTEAYQTDRSDDVDAWAPIPSREGGRIPDTFHYGKLRRVPLGRASR